MRISRKYLFLPAFILAGLVIFFCGISLRKAEKRFAVVFYNVENLFDTKDDALVNDDDFLPQGRLKWTEDRYREKLNRLSMVLSEPGGRNLPGLIGLCEVENRQVVEELSVTGRLRKGRYAVVHQDSPDSRGIDVALIYRQDLFRMSGYRVLPVVIPGRQAPSTRDVLHVWGFSPDGSELHIFVNHWPSRVGGVAATEPGRISAARTVRNAVDSLFQADPGKHIIIMGDMNDTPADSSLLAVLGGARPGDPSSTGLVNLMFPAYEEGEGSYYYQGTWDMLDNMLVSSSLLGERGLRVENARGYVLQRNWMTFTRPEGVQVPDRTYVGDRYTGGISDHFPVFFRLIR